MLFYTFSIVFHDFYNVSFVLFFFTTLSLFFLSGQPTPIPAPLIDALLQSQDPDTGLFHPEAPLFKAGQTVTIVDGPLEGLEGSPLTLLPGLIPNLWIRVR